MSVHRDIDLTSTLLKLKRAVHLAEELRGLVSDYLQDDPPPLSYYSRSTPEPNASESRDYTVFVSINRRPPRELSPVIGDAIRNIRSALDCLAHELAPPDTGHTGRPFPIHANRFAFEETALPSIQTFSDEHKRLIENVQPFHWPEPAQHPLAILDALSKRDRRHLVIPTVAASRKEMVDAENVDIVYSQWHPGPLDDGDAILQFTATPRDSSKPVVVAPVTDLYLGLDQYPFPDVDLVSAIEQLHHYVRHEVIGSYFEYGIIPPVHQLSAT